MAGELDNILVQVDKLLTRVNELLSDNNIEIEPDDIKQIDAPSEEDISEQIVSDDGFFDEKTELLMEDNIPVPTVHKVKVKLPFRTSAPKTQADSFMEQDRALEQNETDEQVDALKTELSDFLEQNSVFVNNQNDEDMYSESWLDSKEQMESLLEEIKLQIKQPVDDSIEDEIDLTDLDRFPIEHDEEELPIIGSELPIIPDELLDITEQPATSEQLKPKKKRKGLSAGDIVYFVILLLIVFVSYLYVGTDGAPRNVAGYTFSTVLTGSMRSEIPQGSLVITKKTDPKDIKVGDDITYIREDLTSVTHRVIQIHEDYAESGERAFRTKGIDNTMADNQLVHSKNIVGVVKYHVAGVGKVGKYIQDNPLYFVALGIILIVLIYVIRYLVNSKRESAELAEEIKK